MNGHSAKRSLFAFVCFLAFALGEPAMVVGQGGYHVRQFTARDGLPQNSVRQMVFDDQGFLWLATEAGIARFDGRSVKVYGDEDHPGLSNRRFTDAVRCLDSTILFVDQLSGMFSLADGRFITRQSASGSNAGVPAILGGLPDDRIIRDNAVFADAIGNLAMQEGAVVFPLTRDSILLVGTDIHGYHVKRGTIACLWRGGFNPMHFGLVGQQVVRVNTTGGFERLDRAGFKPVSVIDRNGRAFRADMAGTRMFSKWPFRSVFLKDGGALFRLLPGSGPDTLIIDLVIDRLPEQCQVKSVDERPGQGLVFIGTDSRGLFIYRQTPFTSLASGDHDSASTNVRYAQAMLDTTLFVTSGGTLIDHRTGHVRGRLPFTPYKYQLETTEDGTLYAMDAADLNKLKCCRAGRSRPVCRLLGHGIRAHAVKRFGDRIWCGTADGIGYIQADSMRVVYRYPLSHRRAVNRMAFGPDGKLWMASVLQLYRLDTLALTLDSVPEFANKECRTLEMIGDKLFLGTYGHGYYVLAGSRIHRMPLGPGNILSNVHAFVADDAGYLWMTTNRGLVRTRLDAVEAYLQDSTRQLACYVYLEENGIRNTEFNGGCAPSHLWLPDGRISFPSLEGYVVFHPEDVPLEYNADSVVIEHVVIDGNRYAPGQRTVMPPGHASIGFTFATPWWGLPVNLRVEYRLEGLEGRFTALDPNERSCTFGHLPPGMYTLVFRKRIGFGPEDFVYSRFAFRVAAPWYATTWAFLGYAGAAIMLIWGVSSLRARSVRQRNIRLSQMVEEQTAALRHNIRVRDRLMSIITHDILTPLRFIGLIAKLGSDTTSDPSSGQPAQALADVRNAVGKLFHSTQNMLDWARYHREGFRPVMTRCAPFVIVDQLVQDFSEMSQFQGNEIVNAVPEDDIIRTDAQVLQVILHNLFSNAVKFTTQGKIVIRSASAPEGYMLEVADTGRGMTERQLEAVRAGALTRLDTPVDALAAGTGIGLSLVDELVAALGGRWTIDSDAGQGVSVRIFLPPGGPQEVT